MMKITRMSCAVTALSLSTIGTPAIHADVVIDEFSGVDPAQSIWPFVQTDGQNADFFENASGVIFGNNGGIRESFISNVDFANPGVDIATMNVDTNLGQFTYDATDGVSNFVSFSYGFVIQNNLHADFSGEHGILFDFSEVDLNGGFLQLSAFVVDNNFTFAESPFTFVGGDGAQSVLLTFDSFTNGEGLDLTDIAAVGVEIFVSNGSSFALDRLAAAVPAPGALMLLVTGLARARTRRRVS